MKPHHSAFRSVSASLLLAQASFAAPAITGVTAQQRYPWNGKVDISYTVSGNIADMAKEQALITSLKVTATDRDAGRTYTASSLSGDTDLGNGTHKCIWDMDAQGLTLKSTNVVFSVSCETTPATYCVIDLSGGTNVTSYPVTYLAAPPSGGFNADAYKTTNLVLKRIESGSFQMGDDGVDVTLTKPFFIGLFEMTRMQYSLVMGTDLNGNNMRPQAVVSYTAIRGSSDGSKWPASNAVDASSFMGKLRARTGLDFDLPTEAQWEYACRAGTTTTYSYGNSANGNYMWYYDNASNDPSTARFAHDVGTKLPNPWGLYDMHGNAEEWCLDWYKSSLSGGIDPKGPSSGSGRVSRGGAYYFVATVCTSSHRGMGSSVAYQGFRLARTLAQ